MIVDVRAHYCPRAYLEKAGRTEFPVAGAAPLRERATGCRLALTDRPGIGLQVLSCVQEPWDGAHAGLNRFVEAPSPDTVKALSPAISGTADQYPRREFIVPRPGGTLPLIPARALMTATGNGGQTPQRMYGDMVPGSVPSGSVPGLRLDAGFRGPGRLPGALLGPASRGI